MNFEAWWKAHLVKEEMRYRTAAHAMFDFYSRVIPQAFKIPYDKRNDFLQVIGEHTSKSIVLPVVKYTHKLYKSERACEIVMRDNFHGNVVCVKVPKGIPTIDPKYIETLGDLENAPGFYQGIPEEYIFGSYMDFAIARACNEDCPGFSIEFNSEFETYTFMYLLKTMCIDKS